MASVRSIAKRAGCSVATVSRVLNNDPSVARKMRETVLLVANRIGYVHGRARRAAQTIGFAYLGERTLSHPFDAAVLDGVAQGADEARHDITILMLTRDRRPDESYTQLFTRKGIRGVILRTTAATRATCQDIADEGFPHVVLSEQFEAPNVSYIDGDSRAQSLRAVEYLISLGHERIAFAMHNVPDRDHMDRFEAYKAALQGQDLPLDERLVFLHRASLSGGATIMTMSPRLANPPTAIFFADPISAIGAVKKSHELGIRIPEDVSIVGFDDTDMRFSVHPTLTAVCQDAAALGLEASRWLCRAMTHSKREPLRKTVPTFLEVNASTGPPPRCEMLGGAVLRERGVG